MKIVGEGARVTARVDHYLEGMAERWREVEGVEKVDIEEDEAVLLAEDAERGAAAAVRDGRRGRLAHHRDQRHASPTSRWCSCT